MPFVGHRAGFPKDEIAVSVACCASTSYKTVDGFDMTLERARPLVDKLASSRPAHASPFEHVAQVDEWLVDPDFGAGWGAEYQHANFIGFKQYRKILGL